MNGSTMRSRKKSEDICKQMKMNTQQPKMLGHSIGNPEKGVHRNTALPNEDRKISNKQPNPTSIRTRGTTTNKALS